MQAFIKKTHCWINGMIGSWCNYTIVCIVKANDSGAYDEGSASSQLKFSKDKKVLEVMKGLDKFNNVTVSVLHYDDIMCIVEVVRDQELADFLVCMANYNAFKLIIAPMNRNKKKFKEITKFASGDVTQKKVYGKHG